jgi:hypothetical protein
VVDIISPGQMPLRWEFSEKHLDLATRCIPYQEYSRYLDMDRCFFGCFHLISLDKLPITRGKSANTGPEPGLTSDTMPPRIADSLP